MDCRLDIRRCAPVFVCLSLAVVDVAASEDSPRFTPYAEVGTLNYSLEFDGDLPIPGGSFVPVNNRFNFSLMSIKVGLAASYGRLYVNVHYQTTDESSDVQIIPGLPTVKWAGERTEASAAVGYSVTESLSVFGGYRTSESPGSGGPGNDYKFEHDGYFLGASYFVSMTDTGGITLSAGNAWLDATVTETLLGFEFPKAEGDGSGIKFGISWNDSINQNWSYSVSANRFDYDYDIDVGDGGAIDVEESETTINIGLSYAF